MKVDISFGSVNLPDFMIVGAGKSGTSSLHHYLNEHPDVFMPWLKETWFFHLIDNPNKAILEKYPYLPTNFLSYLGLYADAHEGQVCGEATPSYLYFHKLAIPNIKKYHPNWKDIKIIIILREPIDKVVSHYKFVHTRGLDPDRLTLKEALKKEPQRIREDRILQDVFYVDNTLYYEQVKSYKDQFPNVKIFLYEELKVNPQALVRELYEYIGVDSAFKPLSLLKVFNKSERKLVARSRLFEKLGQKRKYFDGLVPTFLKKGMKRVLYKEEVIDDETIDFLKTAFKEDVKKLQGIVDKDISHWMAKYE